LSIRRHEIIVQLNIQGGIKIRWMSQDREQMTDDLNTLSSIDDCFDNQCNFMKSKLINGGVTNSIVSFKVQRHKTYYENCAVVKEQHRGRTGGKLGMG